MTYKETLDYIFAALPMYQRVGKTAFKKDLTNTRALCAAVGNPQNGLKIVHIGGTNGKGSSSHFVAAALQAAGYRVGLYTSPHYRDFRERIKINGVYISENAVIGFIKTYKADIERIEPSFFEMTVALAFHYFAAEKVDVAIIEVGLGGRLDSTNIVEPLLALITNISLDHQDMLGDTLPLIAAEKAGIIKPHKYIVVSERHAETEGVFLATARAALSPIVFADEQYQVLSYENTSDKMRVEVLNKPSCSTTVYTLDAQGGYQRHNLLGVLTTLDLLKPHFTRLDAARILEGLANVKTLTNMIGRWQIIGEKPMIIADSGHNEGGLRQTIPQLEALNFGQLHIVLGVVSDKDIRNILALLPKKAIYYFAKANITRGMYADDLQQRAAEFELFGAVYASVAAAFEAAKTAAQPKDVVFVGGSCFTVAEVV